MRRGFKWAGLTLLVLVLLSCIGLVAPLDLAANLVVGWAFYLYRVVPRVRVEWSGVALAVFCLMLFGAGAHTFLDWLHSQIRGKDRRWPARWTVALVAGVVLMFVAGVAATGVAHQVGWLVTSKESLVDASGAREPARRAQSTNNLKQMGMGLDNYHQMSDVFPPGGTFSPSDEPLHGWMADLLPFVENRAIHDKIDFARPWTDSRNREAYQTIVHGYVHPSIPSRQDASGYALSHYAGNVHVLGGNVPRKLSDLVDGASTTFLAGEARGNYKPWGSPTNWRDPALGLNRSPNGFGGPSPGGANMLFADGSVRFIKDTIDPKVFRALGTPDAGETIRPEDY